MASLQALRAAGTPWAIINLNNRLFAKQRRGYVNLLTVLCHFSGEPITIKNTIGGEKELWLEKKESRHLQSELKECIFYIHQPQFQWNDARRGGDKGTYPPVCPIKTLVECLMVSMTEFSLEGTGCFSETCGTREFSVCECVIRCIQRCEASQLCHLKCIQEIQLCTFDSSGKSHLELY